MCNYVKSNVYKLVKLLSVDKNVKVNFYCKLGTGKGRPCHFVKFTM